MKYTYIPENVCSTLFEFEIENFIVKHAKIINGCPGNSFGICNLIKDKHIDEIIKTLKGIPCRNKKTSCPDQIALALIKYKNKK